MSNFNNKTPDNIEEIFAPKRTASLKALDRLVSYAILIWEPFLMQRLRSRGSEIPKRYLPGYHLRTVATVEEREALKNLKSEDIEKDESHIQWQP